MATLRLKEQFNLPAVSVEIRHRLRWNGEVVGQEVERRCGYKIKPQVLVSIQGASGANQYLSEICLDTPVSAFIRVGHGALSFWARRQTSISRRL